MIGINRKPEIVRRRPKLRDPEHPPFFVEDLGARMSVNCRYLVVGTFRTGECSDLAVPKTAVGDLVATDAYAAVMLAELLNELHQRNLIDWSGNRPVIRR